MDQLIDVLDREIAIARSHRWRKERCEVNLFRVHPRIVHHRPGVFQDQTLTAIQKR